jgi:hypothetical protein
MADAASSTFSICIGPYLLSLSSAPSPNFPGKRIPIRVTPLFPSMSRYQVKAEIN